MPPNFYFIHFPRIPRSKINFGHSSAKKQKEDTFNQRKGPFPALTMMMKKLQPISLYVHVPFCLNKCYFCSFVIAVGKEHRMDEYIECLACEAAEYRGMELKTVYVGGGTPSLLNGAQLTRLTEIIHDNFKVLPGAEFSIEANPATFDVAKAKLMADLGFNRVSLGVQSLNDRSLRFLGRAHDSAQAREAFDHLRQAGFKNINLDLMYSFPQQSLPEIEEDVCGIAAMGSEHLSLYTLTVEEGSRFHRQKFLWPDATVQSDQYALVNRLLAKYSFQQYEVSNYSKIGFNSRHNRGYWLGENYAGLGVGAHSHIDGKRFWNTSDLKTYLQSLKSGQTPVAGQENLSPQQRLAEMLVFGLRMNEGVDIDGLQTKLGSRISSQGLLVINQLIDGGLLAREKGKLTATDQGRLALDDISARLI